MYELQQVLFFPQPRKIFDLFTFKHQINSPRNPFRTYSLNSHAQSLKITRTRKLTYKMCVLAIDSVNNLINSELFHILSPQSKTHQGLSNINCNEKNMSMMKITGKPSRSQF